METAKETVIGNPLYDQFDEDTLSYVLALQDALTAISGNSSATVTLLRLLIAACIQRDSANVGDTVI